jgi:glycosyltransferase involved in cell wall biosynthesis
MGHESVWLSSDLPRQPAPAPGYLRVPASDLPFQTLGVAYPLWSPRAAALLRERIEWCDAVNPHDCLYPGTLLALRYARRAGKPLILTQHAGPWPFYRSPVLRAVQLAAYRTLGLAVHRRVAQAVFISRAVEAWFGARVRYARPARFFTNGVDTALFSYGDAAARRAARERLGLPLDRRIVLYVGRFLFMKGLPVIEALARRDPQALFVLIGAGPLDPRRWNLPNVVSSVSTPGRSARLLLGRRCADPPFDRRGLRSWSWKRWCAARPAIVSAETYAAWNEGREYFLVCDSTRGDRRRPGDATAAPLDPDARERIQNCLRALVPGTGIRLAQDYVALMTEMLA